MSQQDVDLQMSPSKWSKRLGPDAVIAAHCKILADESAAARDGLHCELNVPVPNSTQTLDITFPSAQNDARKVFFYIHGGMWQYFSKRESLYMARTLCRSGVTVVAPDYTIAPAGTMAQMVGEVRAALVWVLRRFPDHEIFVAGHSAGGHLAMLAAMCDWNSLGCPSGPARIKGVIPVSGLFDLQPVKDCYANEALKLTDEDVKTYSPSILVADASCNYTEFSHMQVDVVYAEHDPTEFRSQSASLVKALVGRGIPCREHDIANMDHFDVVECLSCPTSQTTSLVLKSMGLS